MQKELLKLARVVAGFSQRELAEHLQINQSTLSRYEQGIIKLPEDIKTKVVEALATKGLEQEEIYLLSQLKRG